VLRVGLTGGIACGKSHVLRRLAERGLHTLDLDGVAHRITASGGSGHAEVVAAFGERVLAPDGGLDRKKLGAIVFADPQALSLLNALVHPRVREEEGRWAASFAGEPGAILVTDAALLVETGMHLRFDRLVVVHCAPAEQVRRLMARDRLEEGAAVARLKAQMPVAEKRRFAHYEVDTSGTLAETDQVADRLARELEATTLAPRFALPRPRALGCLMHGPREGPRGLSPAAVLADIGTANGLEMERLARRLVPSASGPWFRAALSADDEVGPETLAGALVIWALARGGPDPAFLASAAASLARLTHRRGISDSCLLSLMIQAVAVDGKVVPALEQSFAEWSALAARWGGEPPTGRPLAAWRAAVAHPLDPPAARSACRSAGLDPGLAGALVGIATGPREEPEGALASAVDGIERLRTSG
jgi:dephospho-CoA kinase